MGLAVSLKTGRPTKWPKHPYPTGTDRAEFNCAHEGTWWIMASGEQHRNHNVPSGMVMIYPRYHFNQRKIVPHDQVNIPLQGARE